jgi:hypothetical protein
LGAERLPGYACDRLMCRRRRRIDSGVSLSGIAGNNNVGVNGFSPFGDPSFVGSTDEVRIYRFPLNQAQVTQDYIEHLGE